MYQLACTTFTFDFTFELLICSYVTYRARKMIHACEMADSHADSADPTPRRRPPSAERGASRALSTSPARAGPSPAQLCPTSIPLDLPVPRCRSAFGLAARGGAHVHARAGTRMWKLASPQIAHCICGSSAFMPFIIEVCKRRQASPSDHPCDSMSWAPRRSLQGPLQLWASETLAERRQPRGGVRSPAG
jgi:hypothetical protein